MFSKSTELFDKSQNFQLDIIIALISTFECRLCGKNLTTSPIYETHEKRLLSSLSSFFSLITL